VAFILATAYHLSYFLPLQQSVNSAAFVNAPLMDVLQTLSVHRQTQPYRRFVICDAQTLNKRVTVSFPTVVRWVRHSI
jgi:hypothetical protein